MEELRRSTQVAFLYSETQRLKEAETDYQEALDIRHQLAKTNILTLSRQP
ncbi:hypothetical protein EDE15_4783 [Edaphobacter aggregans]|uniref:Tetratricopeptide repeat protein n=1 Tax=Edaphobacter aggregans TaxID=570835 RepID=A0A428MQH7_9BACT|nr:hypothetical protein EDE15_4783 [Edaphobacter aggregans]